MLPLAGSDFPASLETLVASLRAGLGGRGVLAKDIRANGEWPRLAELAIDLTGAQLSRDTRFAQTGAETQAGVTIERLSIVAAPLHFEATPVRVDVVANQAACAFASGPALQLVRAGSGSVAIEAQRADLEVALKKIATAVLAKQGVDVKAAHLELTERGSRALSFRAEITAKAFLMTARVAVTGHLDVDENLNLRVSHLATSGDGMIANLAGGFLRPRFLEIEKRVIPLAAYSIAGVKLHGVRIGGGNALRLEAQFGG